MASIGEAAAEGLRSGFGMGMQYDAAQEAKRARAASEAQQAEELGLRRQQLEQQTARQKVLDERQATHDEYAALKDEHADVLQRVSALQAAGQELPPELQARAADVTGRLRQHHATVLAPKLAAERQGALDFFSGVQAGRVDPLADSVTPAQLYRHISLATGRTPEQIGQAATGVQQIQEGLQTGNQALMLQGVNALAAPDLRAGVGQPSPHGGTIVKKEVHRLVPVRDANGVEHPDKVFPIIRVYTDRKGPDGSPLYYDAPLTENRSSDPDDPVKAIDLKHAFDYMGNVGTLAVALQDPRVAGKLAQGAKEAGAQTQADLDEMNALGRAELAKHASGQLAKDLAAIRNDPTMTDAEKEDAIAVRTGRKAKPIAAQTGGLANTYAAIDSLPVSDARKLELKEQAVPGGARKAGSAVALSGKGVGKGMNGGIGDGAGRTDLSPATLEFYATMDLMGQRDWRVGLGRSKHGSDLIVAVDKFVPELAGKLGLSAQDVGTAKAEFAAYNKALSDRVKYSAAVEQLTGTVNKQADLVLSLMGKGAAGSGSPIINKWIQAGRKATGDPDVAAFDMAIVGLAREHQRVLTSPLSNAQLAVAAQKTGDALLNDAKTPEQIRKLVDVMRTEAKNGKEQADAAVGELKAKMKAIGGRSGMAGGGGPAPSASGLSFAGEQEAMAAVKAGKVKAGDVITIGGRKRKWEWED